MNDLVNPQLVNADSYKRGCTSTGTTSFPEPAVQGHNQPDLRWKKVTPKPAASDESGLSPEQVSWLNQMTEIYGDQFERQQWTESFRQQNMEATMAAMAAPAVQPALPPAQSVQPAAPTFQPPTPPTSAEADPSAAWAAYSRQYREYKEWWDKHGSAYAATYPQSAGTASDPEAWKSYSSQTPSSYYPGYNAQTPAPPLPSGPGWNPRGPAPPLPKTPAPK